VLVDTIPALRFELNKANLSSLVVDDLHLADMLDIHRAKDQVLDVRHGAKDRVVLACAL